MHKFNSSILRAYDIRGVYQETLFDKDAYYIAKSFATILHGKGQNKIVVGGDGRSSTASLKDELIKGFVESGIDVVDIGLCPTPMLYFAVFHLGYDAGIMVTGSHNPKNHNGFKIALKDRPFYGDDIIHLAQLAESGDFITGKGKKAAEDISQAYIARILQDYVSGDNNLSIAWDCGNGAAGNIVQDLTKKIPAKHHLLYAEVDGNFPNHHPDPTEEKNMQDLIATVKSNSCDIGIAFDGDGDRIGVVDDEGYIIWGDQLMVFFAQDVLVDNPGATIIADGKASNILFSEIAKAGGKEIMWKTGHSLIKAKMKEEKALLAGEMSGHIFFADKYYGFDDAIYSAIRVINILIKSGKKLSDLRKTLPQTFSTPEIRVECDDDKKFAIVEQIKSKLDDKGLQYNNVDGVRFVKNNDWWLIRASNTQPVLVARCESVSESGLILLKKELVDILQDCGMNIPSELQSDNLAEIKL